MSKDSRAQRHDFVCYSGDDFIRTLLIKDEDTLVAENITGREYSMAVYQSYEDKINGDDPVISSDDIDFSFIESVEGTLSIRIESEITGSIEIDVGSVPFPSTECFYDIVETDVDGDEVTILYGSFIFEKRLT